MGKHVDGCWWSDVLMDNCLSSLDQAGSGNGIVFWPCRRATRNTTFPLPMTIVSWVCCWICPQWCCCWCEWVQVSKFLKDKSYYLCFLWVEKECSKFSFGGRYCNKFEYGASDMDCAIDEYWLSVSRNADKEEAATCTTVCLGGTEAGGIRMYVQDHVWSTIPDFLHWGASTCSQGIGSHVEEFLQLVNFVVWQWLVMPLEW